MANRSILVLAVDYNSPGEVARMRAEIDSATTNELDLVIVDNSPEPAPDFDPAPASPARLMHFPDNPGFCGGARRALSALVAEHGGPLPYRAVILTNTDLRTDWDQVPVVVDETTAEYQGSAWILAPDIVEAGRRYRANPAGFTATASRRRQRLLRSSKTAFSLYWWLSQQKRARKENPHAESARWTPMYRPYGAFMIFGAGYFARGGVIHDGPLFNEEEAFARIAQHVDVPILFEPELRVDHQAGLTYKHRAGVYRQRYDWHRAAEDFYDGWHPSHVVGSMKTWFVDDSVSG